MNKWVILLILAGLPCLERGIALAEQTLPQASLFPAQPTLMPSPAELSIPVLEDTVYELVNQHRLSLGLSPLIRVSGLSLLAREHSQEMAQRKVRFGHSNFVWRVRQVDHMISSRRVSENVAYIFTHRETAKRAVQGWLRSDRHRDALEGRYQFTGIGVAQGDRGAFYFTQIYVQPR